MTISFLLILFAYLLGSIPVGLVMGRCLGVDVREKGSANIGATNVSRVLGKKIGLATLAGDALKGALPMLLAAWLLDGRQNAAVIIHICGGVAFLGHLFPVFLGFKGGKGVATALGVFLYLEPMAILMVALLFLIIVIKWRYVSAGSLAASGLLPPAVFLVGAEPNSVYLAAGVAIFIWISHRANINRLIRGKESKWGRQS